MKEGWAERDGRRAGSIFPPQPSGCSPRTSKARATPFHQGTVGARSARHVPWFTCDEWSAQVRNRWCRSAGVLQRFCAPDIGGNRPAAADLARVVPPGIKSMFTRYSPCTALSAADQPIVDRRTQWHPLSAAVNNPMVCGAQGGPCSISVVSAATNIAFPPSAQK